MSGKWERVAQLGLMVAGGIGCLLLGKVEIGTMLLSAAAGQLIPNNAFSATVEQAKKLPPFYRKGPGSP